MTLSGKSDSSERAEVARAARQERAAAASAKRPWVIPLAVGIAVVGLVVVIVLTLVFGISP